MPGLLAGRLSTLVDVQGPATGYAVLAAVAASVAVVLVGTIRPQPLPPPFSRP